MEATWWGFPKGVSSLSDLRLALYVDGLLDDVTGLIGFCLVPESDESSNNDFDDLSEDDEDEESENISIYFCAVWTRYFPFACSIADFAACWPPGTCCSLFI